MSGLEWEEVSCVIILIVINTNTEALGDLDCEASVILVHTLWTRKRERWAAKSTHTGDTGGSSLG